MACFHPLEAWRGRAGGPAVFSKPVDYPAIRLDLPCGQCIGCRLERSRQWAVRMMHEASLHLDNCFVTFTYAPEHLPRDLSLNKRHFQLFMKRLRKRCGKVRFFHCGEYGETTGRPHYHAILFGFDFPDKVFYSGDGENRVYTSELLDELWGFGECKIGSVTFESCAYVARYILKKVTGDAAEQHYLRCDEFGEAFSITPEYVTMSRRPGIAYEWFRKFGNEVFPSDEVISRGHAVRPPRYYDNLLELAEPSVFDSVKRKRIVDISKHAEDLTPERLRSREACAKARASFSKRTVD
ncbi:replication associated protein [Microviridae sp.]|nr:replication associated protein [Microviridae sp.]UOF81751.1 replication associated protein [Microviridae sp.]